MREFIEYYLPGDPSILQKLLLEKGDIPHQSTTRSNGLRDESLLSERDSDRLRLTRHFEERQRRRVSGRTLGGRITLIRDRHYSGEDRDWDEKETPRSVLLQRARLMDIDEELYWTSLANNPLH